MPLPTVVAVGALPASNATTTMTPGLPAGAAVGDVLVTVAESTGGQVYTVPSGWAHVTGSPLNIDTTTCLTVIWRRHDGSAAPAIALPSGDHAIGRMIAIRGVVASGNPWNAAPTTSADSTVTATATWPAVTTTVADCLMLFCIATGRDLATTANLGAMTGGTGLTSIVEQMDNWVATGAGGGVGLVTAAKLAAGTTGAPVATMGTTEPRAMMTIALQGAAATVLPGLFMSPMRR